LIYIVWDANQSLTITESKYNDRRANQIIKS